ncbi:DUF4179 domain-containing protein [Shouchella clausii]
MGHLPNRTGSGELDTLERWIRESDMPRATMSDEIMNKIEERTMSRTAAKQKGMLKKTLIAASTAAALGAGVIGTGFVSPAMAATMSKIPVIGSIFTGVNDAGLQTAAERGIVSSPNLSVTHDGVTLTVADLLYDGTRLSFALDRQGVDLETAASPYITAEEAGPNPNDWIKKRIVPENEQKKGYIERPEVLVNGQPLKFDKGGMGDTTKQNAYLAEMTGLKNVPDAFELTIRTKVTRVDEPFEFTVPVNVKDKSVTVKPEADTATASSRGFSYTVDQLVITPVSTRLILDSTGPVPASKEQSGDYQASMVYYELVDDQGNTVDLNMYGYFHSNPKTEYHVDELYGAFASTPKSITIKPYTLTYNKKDWSVVGGGNGSLGERTYLKDLELTIPVPSDSK